MPTPILELDGYSLYDTVGTWNMTLANCGVYLRGGGSNIFGTPPIRTTTRANAGPMGGSTVNVNSHAHRDVIVPLKIVAESAADLPAAIAEVIAALDPIRRQRDQGYGNGSLRLVYGADGTSSYNRYLDGVVISGLQSAIRYRGERTAELTPVIRCDVPYWQGFLDPLGTITLNGAAPDSIDYSEWNYGNPFPDGVLVGDYDKWGKLDYSITDDSFVGLWPSFSWTANGVTYGRRVIGFDDNSTLGTDKYAINILGTGTGPNVLTINTYPNESRSTGVFVTPTLMSAFGPGNNTFWCGCEVAAGSGDPTVEISGTGLYLSPVG